MLAVVPLFAAVFWLTAVIASSFPKTAAVAVNVHSLTLTAFGGDLNQRPAPLSLSVLADVRQDATPASSGASPTTHPTPTRSVTPRPTVTASATPSPSATGVPLPLPSPTPTPTPTP